MWTAPVIWTIRCGTGARSGLILSAVLIAAIWLGAVLVAIGKRRKVAKTSRTATVVTMLGAAMLTLTLLGPAVQLWYLLWALPFLTRATDHRRTVIALVAIQTAMVFTVDPHGLSFTMKPVVTVIIAVSAVVAWLALRDDHRRPVTVGRRRPPPCPGRCARRRRRPPLT